MSNEQQAQETEGSNLAMSEGGGENASMQEIQLIEQHLTD